MPASVAGSAGLRSQSRSRRRHEGDGYYDDNDDDVVFDPKQECLELRMRTAVGDGQLEVNLANAHICDDDVKYLSLLLTEAENAASGRKQAASAAQLSLIHI